MPWTDVSMILLSLVMAGLLVAAATRRSTRTAGTVLLLLAGWLLATAFVARSGALARWDERPPRLVFVPVSAVLVALLARRTAAFRALLAALPRAALIGAQTFRVGVELVLYGLLITGRAPEQVTFAGRNFDVLVGLTAPLLAMAVARGKAGPALVTAWNVCGLGILANTVFTVLTSTPGPLHLPWPGAPLTVLADWPFVWLPAFLAPLAVFLHISSLQQTLPLLRQRPATEVACPH